ncbi:AAA family ATPase [Corynebacterium oculi]|uniref:Chromosome segregation protein n=1 Tax=Corynebacterium oculi TaxID=1544416 RepID=A0A0Q0U876_9CORY|nr:AAA family ATPase [Corynebacterium oculi]KQB83767.1 chromosome segregation protein [Corynebacterium oculi]
MKIRSLVVDNFRGVPHLELSDVPERGVVLIAGDNEQGKSTLMEAVGAVLRERHSAKNKKVKTWQPVGTDEAPQVSLTATVGPYEVEITKRWLRRPMCTLRLSGADTENLSGREADDRLERLLAEHTDEHLLNALFLEQGQAVALAQAAGIPSLTRVLDEHTGNEAQDSQADSALLAAVAQEYQRYYTEGGKPRGELRAAQQEDTQARENLAQVREEMENLAAQVDKVESLRRREAEARRDLPEAEEAAATAQARHQAAAKATEESARAQQELRDATVLWESAEARRAERRGLRKQCEESAAALHDLEAEYEEARRAARRDRAALTEAVAARETSRKALAEAKKKHAIAKKALRVASARQRLSEAEELLARVAEFDERLAGLDSRTVTKAQLAEAENAYSEVRVAQAVRSRTTARLLLSGPQDTTVLLDETPTPLPQEVELHEGTRVQIGEVTAVYSQGEGQREDPVPAAEEALAEILAALECASLDEARAAAEATEQRALVHKEREAALQGHRPEEVRAEYEDLRARVADDADIPTPAQAEEAEEEASREVEECEEADHLAAQTVEDLRESPTVAGLARAETGKELAAQRHADLKAQLEQADKENPEENLKAAEQEAAARRDSVQVAYERAKRAEEGTDPEQSERLWRGAEARCESLREEMSRTTRELDRLSSHIEAANGAGERLVQAEAQAEAGGRRLAAVQRRAHAVETVREVLLRHRDAARSRYAGPFARQLTALGRTVFGRDVEFRLTEHLGVGERVLGGLNIAVDDLSGGAQEQVALVTRFAIAELVGDAMPVFIDDALGSTDPERLALMAALLSQVGETHQVFVLTCVPQRYAQVVKQRDYRIEDLKSS